MKWILGVTGALFLACLSVACGDSPITPTLGPKMTCPAPITQASPLGARVSVVYPLPTVTGGTPPLVGPTCAPGTGSSFPVGVTTVTCTVTDAVARGDLCSFTVAVTTPPRLVVTRFFAFGDSMTYGEDGRNSITSASSPRQSIHPLVRFDAPDRYPEALQAELAARYTLQSVRVDNDGLPDEEVLGANTFARFDGLVVTGSHDAALIMEGANDLAGVADGLTTYAAIAAGLGRMIDDARAHGLRPLLATIPPENPAGSRGSKTAALVPAFNDQVRLLAASRGVPLVDVFQAFNGNLSLVGADGLHPTAAGYHLVADTFFNTIVQTLETK